MNEYERVGLVARFRHDGFPLLDVLEQTGVNQRRVGPVARQRQIPVGHHSVCRQANVRLLAVGVGEFEAAALDAAKAVVAAAPAPVTPTTGA